MEDIDRADMAQTNYRGRKHLKVGSFSMIDITSHDNSMQLIAKMIKLRMQAE